MGLGEEGYNRLNLQNTCTYQGNHQFLEKLMLSQVWPISANVLTHTSKKSVKCTARWFIDIFHTSISVYTSIQAGWSLLLKIVISFSVIVEQHKILATKEKVHRTELKLSLERNNWDSYVSIRQVSKHRASTAAACDSCRRNVLWNREHFRRA